MTADVSRCLCGTGIAISDSRVQPTGLIALSLACSKHQFQQQATKRHLTFSNGVYEYTYPCNVIIQMAVEDNHMSVGVGHTTTDDDEK